MLNGTLAFIKDGAAWVAPAAGSAAPRRLPQSERASHVAIAAPAGGKGVVLYFAAVPGGKTDRYDSAPLARGWMSRPPYASAQPLPGALARARVERVVWRGDGAGAFITLVEGANDALRRRVGLLRVKENRWEPLHAAAPVESASRDGSVIVYQTNTGIAARTGGGTGPEQALLHVGRPAPLLDALRRARFPKNVSNLTNPDNADLRREARHWAWGAPTVTPDGKTVFFATNAGTSQGAAGNTTFCFFAADPATGRLSVLSRLGEHFSRIPDVCRVSPGGDRLLYVTSTHHNAAHNPSTLLVVNLPTQTLVRSSYLEPPAGLKDASNLVDGACWSPDGRFVAASALFYSVAGIGKKMEAGWEPRSRDFVLTVYDVATGRALRRIVGATRPSWGAA